MLAYLNLEKYLKYDLQKPPGIDNSGGGVATKTQRVLEACAPWMIKGTHKFSSASKYHVVLVEPLVFCANNEMSVEDRVEAYEGMDCIKILYCTEMAFVRIPKPLRDKVVEASDYITCVNRYHRDVFHAYDVPIDSILCDPIPDHVFTPGELKDRKIVAANRIDWKKNTQELINAYEIFKTETDFKLEYVGDAKMWGHDEDTPANKDMAHKLEDICDVYHGAISQADVAKVFGSSAVFFHCAFHDVYSEGLWEALHCGCVPMSHGYHVLFNDITEHRYTDMGELIDSLNNMGPDEFEQESERVKNLANQVCSYATFQTQISDIFKKLGGL